MTDKNHINAEWLAKHLSRWPTYRFEHADICLWLGIEYERTPDGCDHVIAGITREQFLSAKENINKVVH